jgi:hypothetical protein
MDNEPVLPAPEADAPRRPLFYPDDTPRYYELIHEMIDLKYFVSRPSKHHIKHGDVNFWPSTGTITIDGQGRYNEKGKEAFIALLQRMYPRRRRPDPEAPTIHAAPPSSAIFEISLDDAIPDRLPNISKLTGKSAGDAPS